MKKYFQAPWNIKDLTIAFSVSATLLVGILFLNQYLGLEEIVQKSDYRIALLAATFLVQWIIILLPAILLTKFRYKLKWKYLGLQKVGIFKTIGLVIGAYLLYLGIAISITLLILYTGIKIPGYQLQEKLLPQFGSDLSSIITAGIIIVLLAPIIEEIFFRSFILRTLVNKIGKWWGSILTAALFALFHFQFQTAIPIFILGLIINGIVIRSKSVKPAIAFHIFNNAIAFGIEVMLIKEVIQLESIL